MERSAEIKADESVFWRELHAVGLQRRDGSLRRDCDGSLGQVKSVPLKFKTRRRNTSIALVLVLATVITDQRYFLHSCFLTLLALASLIHDGLKVARRNTEQNPKVALYLLHRLLPM